MNLASAGARFRQPGFAGVVTCRAEDDGGDEDAWGAGTVDPPEGCGVAAAEGDAEVLAELDGVGTGVGVADGQVTFGNTWMG